MGEGAFSTFNIQRSTFDVQHSTFNIRRSTFNVQRGVTGSAAQVSQRHRRDIFVELELQAAKAPAGAKDLEPV